MVDFLYVVFTALGSITALFLLTKLMGNKEMSQLSMFDYITGITIGSIAAEMATNLEDFEKPLIAMTIYAVIATLISISSYKSIKVRKIIGGNPIILYEKGKLYNKNLKKARIDINEFLTECRNKGYFDLSKIEVAILETNGKLSIIPISTERPVTPADLQLKPEQEKPVYNIVIDGQIIKNTLKDSGNDIDWLNSLLKAQGVMDLKDVFLVTCDCKNNVKIYTRSEMQYNKSIFE